MISLSDSLRGLSGGECGYRGDLVGRKRVPHQSGGPPRCWATDHRIGRDDQVEAEVAIGLGNVLVEKFPAAQKVWRNTSKLPVWHREEDPHWSTATSTGSEKSSTTTAT